MKAKEARELTKVTAEKEIKVIEKEISQAIRDSKTHLVLKELSEGAKAYFLDNNYTICTDEIDIGRGERLITRIEINW